VKTFVPPWVPEPRHAIFIDDIKSQTTKTRLWDQHLSGHLIGEYQLVRYSR
jgi:hypothetical protein